MYSTVTESYASPTLTTIKMVESALIKSKNSIVSIAELKRRLPKQVNHYTLKTILEYLEESGKIAVSIKGITWIFTGSEVLRNELKRGKKL